METVREALQALDLGKSVAEFDDALERYFIETDAFRELVNDKSDIIAGDKGTGKTAIFRILQKKYGSIPRLRKVEVIAAFNPTGNPIFQQLTTTETLTEAEYNRLWKAYIVSFASNWLLKIYESDYTPSMRVLENVLRGLGLRTEIDEPRNAFSKVLSRVGALFHWRSAELECTVSESGVPIVTPKVEFAPEGNNRKEEVALIDAEAVLRLVDKCLDEADVTVWIALDRLDEAFSGYAATEIPALRALLRTYLDLAEFKRMKLKLFLRRDLFSRITAGGFVNLTHVNARKLEIVWNEDDLKNLLCRRVLENARFCEALALSESSDDEIFACLFPEKVDSGTRKPATWTWMMRRIRDGNDVKPPRNLIDLVQLSQNSQSKRENIRTRRLVERPLLESDALRDGLKQLSKRRVDDTLFAEAGLAVDAIERFRGGKAEHNIQSIASLFDCSVEEARNKVAPLITIGFLEEIKEVYKVPTLFRDGMKITQGKAYEIAAAEENEDYDE